MFDYMLPAEGPVIEGLEEYETLYAQNQPEYMPLRTLRSNRLHNEVLSRWTPTPAQRRAIADGADIFLELATFGRPLQPIRMAIGDRPGALYFHEVYDLHANIAQNGVSEAGPGHYSDGVAEKVRDAQMREPGGIVGGRVVDLFRDRDR